MIPTSLVSFSFSFPFILALAADGASPYSSKCDLQAITKHCVNTIQLVHDPEPYFNTTMFVSPPPLSASTTPVSSLVTLTVVTSILMISAIVWLGKTHSHSTGGVEERRKRMARSILRQQLSPPARRWKEQKQKNRAARSIQTSWRQSSLRLQQERQHELTSPTLLSLFGGNDPYRVSATKTVPMTHVQYRLDDESAASSSSSLPDLVDHKTSRRMHSFRGILLGLTLIVLLARCFVVTEDPWNTVERFSHKVELLARQHVKHFSTKAMVVEEEQPPRKRGSFDCDCNSYAKTLGGAYGPFVPF